MPYYQNIQDYNLKIVIRNAHIEIISYNTWWFALPQHVQNVKSEGSHVLLYSVTIGLKSGAQIECLNQLYT
jgi:hypothetical protein